MRQRLNYIDIAKGIGIILVVLSHTDYSNIMHFALAFYVPIFFFCSGYTTSPMTTETVMKQNFVKHATKLIKPYIFFNLILILIFRQFYLQGFIGVFYSRYCLFPLNSPEPYRFLINGNYPLWFLTCMVVSYFLFYLIIYAPIKYQNYIASSYLVITVLLSNLPILLPWSIDTAFLMALFMYLGMQTRQKIPSLYQSPKPHPLILFSFILYLLMIPLCEGINISIREYGISIAICFIAGLAGCVSVIYFSHILEDSLLGKLLQQIGKHSLTIFCIEIPFIVMIGRPFATYTFMNCPSHPAIPIVTAIIEALIACAGGYALSILLQKNKHIRRLIF